MAPNAEDVLKLPEDLQKPLIKAINNKVARFRQPQIFIQRLLLGYSILGGLILTISALLFAFIISYWISVALAILYFIGLFIVITYSTKRGKMLEKRMLFNLSLVVTNLNNNIGEVYPDSTLVE